MNTKWTKYEDAYNVSYVLRKRYLDNGAQWWRVFGWVEPDVHMRPNTWRLCFGGKTSEVVGTLEEAKTTLLALALLS